MKRILSVIICITFAVLLFTACGENGASPDTAQTGHKLTILDKASREKVTATFQNSDSGDTLEVEMKQSGSVDDKTASYVGYADPALYDRVTVTRDGDSTVELAFNDYVTGWDLTSGTFYPCTAPMTEGDPKYERKTFDYEDRQKDVLIWTPEDYDATSDEKYSVIYMTDGQNLFERGATATGSWGVAESALAMAENGGAKCIIVGVENAPTWRDEELTPDIGEVTEASYENGKGAAFSDFVVDTVMPYIEKNYNVYTDPAHTHISGSSSGGIETFYIAMEHPDKFGSVGALSPAFSLYTDETWVKYLSEKDFSGNAPFIYLYCGNSPADQLEQALYIGTKSMPENLSKVNYPADKIVERYNEKALHNEMYWRAVFPDYLKYAFPKTEKAE